MADELKCIENISPVYTLALLQFPKTYWNYHDIEIPTLTALPFQMDPFPFSKGAFGNVYRASHTSNTFAVKVVTNADLVRNCKKEFKILQNLKSSIHIITAHNLFRYDDKIHFVFNYVENTPLPCLPHKIKTYMFQLLKALDHCHSHAIIHCDVKPGNILFDSKNLLKLIDFGRSKFYFPDHDYHESNELGTAKYRAPEMLFKSKKIHYAVDIWAAGCVFLQLLNPEVFNRFCSGHNDATQVENISRKFGPEKMKELCQKFNWSHFEFSKIDIEQWNIGALELNLLEKMLTLDPLQRITAKNALGHIYFLA